MKLLKIAATVLLAAVLMSNSPYKCYGVTLFTECDGQAILSTVYEKMFAPNNTELCRRILDRLSELQKENTYLKNATVSVKGSCATVNLVRPAQIKMKEGEEALTIYSLVNSLTSTGDIVTVEFTVNGKKQKNYAGFLDMRETFIPDYSPMHCLNPS